MGDVLWAKWCSGSDLFMARSSRVPGSSALRTRLHFTGRCNKAVLRVLRVLRVEATFTIRKPQTQACQRARDLQKGVMERRVANKINK